MKITQQLIERYFKRECTDQEAAFLEDLLKKDPTILDTFFPEREWLESPIDQSYERQDEVYQKLIRHIRPRRKILHLLTRVAVAVAVVSLVLLGIYHRQQSSNPPNRLTTQEAVQKQDEAHLYYINSTNEKMLLTASDGSVITLYPGSEIRYAEDFANLHERTLYLKGYARFDVAKDKTKPFRVVSAGIVTTALGTIFTVNEFNRSTTRVQLIEGSISVSSPSKLTSSPIIKKFNPMEEITIDHQLGQVIEEKKINEGQNERNASFVKDKRGIQFKNLSLADVLSILNHNYGIDLHYRKESLQNKYYSGYFIESPEVYKDIINEINYLHNTNITYTKSITY